MKINHSVLNKPLNPAWSGSLFYLTTFLCNGSYIPFLYVYLSELGLTGEQVGWLASLSPIMIMLLSTTIASIADRSRQRVHITQVALLCIGVIVSLLRIPTTFNSIALLMLFLAIFSSPLISLSDSLIVRMALRNNINYGRMRMWGSFGYAISALGCGALWQVLGFKTMFLVGCLLYLPIIWVTGYLEEGPIIPLQECKPVSYLLRDGSLILLLFATFLSGISYSLAMTFSGIYARSLGAGNFLVGSMFAFGALAEAPTLFFSDRISRYIRKTNLVLLSYGLMAGAYLGYILIKNPALLPIFSILRGFGYGLWITVTFRLVIERTPDEWASTAQSLLTICLFGLAPLVAGPFGGWIHDVISPAAVFGLGVVTLGMAALVLKLASIQKRLD